MAVSMTSGRKAVLFWMSVSCVTGTSRAITIRAPAAGGALKVTVPERLEVVVLSSTVKETVALPKPELFDNVIHETLDEAAQEMFDVTETDLLPIDEVKERDVGEMLKVGSAPSCVTLTV